VAATGDRRFVYATNTHDGTISGYRVAQDGSLSLLAADGLTAATGGARIDAAMSGDSRFLYVEDDGAHTIVGFRVAADGGLVSLGAFGSLPGVPRASPRASGGAPRRWGW
jgi:6-phosphogluconolactonase (cycloisomerase 2 family)